MNQISLRQLFLSHVAQTSFSPLMLEIVKAEGVYLFDKNGKKYMDLIAGISVSNLGHRHPKVVDAIKKQADEYLHLMVYGEYVQSPQVKLAKKLADNLPKNLQSVYFVNSGTEATEGAMKLAKRFTQRTEILACYNSYHGSTQGALSVMGNEFFKQAYRPLLPGIGFIHFGSWSDIDKITSKTAAVIIETIQGEAGIKIACSSYFKLLRKKCDETGTLLILDEIQTGFGRTGKLWAFEHYDIVPDILLLAKGMGGGVPIGAFIASDKIMGVLKEHPFLGHITTFGGHPLCSAAALANLEAILDEKWIETVDLKQKLFIKHLQHPAIKEIRSQGLLMALEFESFDVLKKIIDRCIEQGVITDWFLHCANAMRIAPPLIITEEEIVFSCKIIIESIDWATKEN
jgi:acetylornithine/succinyldiaminopimelate/putrescine aminotransferase